MDRVLLCRYMGLINCLITTITEHLNIEVVVCKLKLDNEDSDECEEDKGRKREKKI